MADHPEDNDPFEEDIVFDEAGLLGGKMPRARRQATAGFLPTFMLFIRTVFLCVAFLGLGMCVSVSGGPLIKLEMSVGVAESTAFHVFTARSVGMLFGGALGSVLFEVYNRQFLLSVSLVWVAAAVTVLPFTVTAALWWTLASTAALGMGLAFLFTGGNVLCLDLWGRRQGGAALQALHFSFSLGALVVPLVVQPFFSGLQPAAPPNTTLSTLPTTLMMETTPAVREIRAALLEDTFQPHNSSPSALETLTHEDLLKLTLPVEKNQTSTILPKDLNHTSTSLPSLSPTATSHTPSTQKQSKKKPAYTDSSKLKPDEVNAWTKLPAGDQQPPPQDPPTEQQKAVTTLPAAENGTVTPSNTTTPIAANTTTNNNNTNTNSSTGHPTPSNSNSTTTTSTAPSSTLSATTTKAVNTSTTTNTNPTTTTTTKPSTTTTTTTAPPSTTTTTTTTTTDTTTTTTTTASTTTTEAPPPVTTPPTTTSTPSTTSTTTVKSKPSTTSPTTTTTTTMKPQTTTTPSTTTTTTTTTTSSPPPQLTAVMVNVDIGSEMMQLTSDDVQTYEVQSTRERLPGEGVSGSGGGGGSGTPSLKPDTYSNASDDKSRFLDHMAQRLGDYGVTRFHLAYISIGILVVVDALVSVVVLCHHPREARSRQEGGPMASARPSRALLFTVLFSAFMFAGEALQGALHHLLATTGENAWLPLTWDGEEGPDGQVVFWGLVCLVRFLCVPAAGCLGPPGRLLAAAVVFAVGGSAFMVVGASGRQDFVWAGVVFMAVGCAPILPTSLLWMAQHMRVTHRLCALMVVLSSFGNTLTHSLLAEAMGDPPTHALVLLGLALASACLLAASVCALHAGQHNPNLGAPVGYQLASQHEEDSLELTPSASVVFTPADAASHEGGEAGQALLID